MKVALALPAGMPGVPGPLVVEWARKIESGPFSSIAVIDRLTYPNWEPLVALSAAAAVTQKVRLMTTLIIAPLRDTALLAKQAATLDVLSGGRLSLGLGVGRREDDFIAANREMPRRGRWFEEQLESMRRVWSGQEPSEGVGPVGPEPVQPGGPEVLIGGSAPAALRRAGRLADGFLGAGDPETAVQQFEVVSRAWQKAGKPGKPRFLATAGIALGRGDAARRGANQVRHYNAVYEPEVIERAVQGLLTSEESIQGTLQRFQDLGLDEIVFVPRIPDIELVDRLSDLVS